MDDKEGGAFFCRNWPLKEGEKRGELVLLPNLLGEEPSPSFLFPPVVAETVASLEGLIAESAAGGRRFLKHFKKHLPIALFHGQDWLRASSSSAQEKELLELLEPLLGGQRWGLVSDAGFPCVADPGYPLVRRARQKGVAVSICPGYSSIFLALALSGLPGQSFAFHGYLPREEEIAKQKLQKMIQDKESTHIVMDTPYRNGKLFKFLLQMLPTHTWLCLAIDVTLPSQQVVTQTVKRWREEPMGQELEKRAALFLFSAR
jgi:16S rRNA (cytidine1402-2'-O)-methyltransferase